MSQFFEIHAGDPQLRLVRRAAEIVREGGVIVYPTDSCYALGCHIGDKTAMGRIRRIRGATRNHHFTLVCRNLAEASAYAKMENASYRMIKHLTPGPYTFILRATREVPKRLQSPKRKAIGIRIPDHPIPQLLLEELGEPLMSSTLLLPGEDRPQTDPLEMRVLLEHDVDAIIDGGNCGIEPTSVIDLVDDLPKILRRGRGDVSSLERS